MKVCTLVILVCLAAAVLPAPAQMNPGAPAVPFQPFANLREFLKLDQTQVETLQKNLDEALRPSQATLTRLAQLRREIAEETAKDRPDPLALGTRYVEIEMLCREMRDKAEAVRDANLAVLTPEQKTKLKVLEDAQKLAPAIAEAIAARLIPGIPMPGPRPLMTPMANGAIQRTVTFVAGADVLTESLGRTEGGMIGAIAGGFGCPVPMGPMPIAAPAMPMPPGQFQRGMPR